MWESREKYELQHESLTLQLGATQADLELVASAFAKSSADLRHARSSNQRLQRWKVVTAPQVEALRIKVGRNWNWKALPILLSEKSQAVPYRQPQATVGCVHKI